MKEWATQIVWGLDDQDSDDDDAEDVVVSADLFHQDASYAYAAKQREVREIEAAFDACCRAFNAINDEIERGEGELREEVLAGG